MTLLLSIAGAFGLVALLAVSLTVIALHVLNFLASIQWF